MFKQLLSFLLFMILLPYALMAQVSSGNKFSLDAKSVQKIMQDLSRTHSDSDYYLNPDIAAKVKERFVLPSQEEILTLRSIKKIDEQRKNTQSLQAQPIDFSQYPESIDLRARDTKVKSQFGGTCTTFGLVAAIENLINNSYNIPDPNSSELSERHFWSTYGVYSVESAIASAKKNYITEEAYWPIDRSSPYSGYLDHAHTKLIDPLYIDDSVEKVIQSLVRGHPVYLGTSTTAGMSSCAAVISPYSKANGGGHALSIVGYRQDKSIEGGGYFIIKNSWGSDCGDSGYQYLPFYHCMRSDLYCMMWEIDKVETEFGNQTAATFDPGQVKASFAYYRRAFQYYYRVTLVMEGPQKQLKLIDNVTYTLSSSGNNKSISSENFVTGFSWFFQSRTINFPVIVTVKLKSGEVFTYNLTVK
ncbi:MAG: C1 family peptidase [Oligoflexia bacterium]|nr:C1 family peptidase [Oligoflexia bacterium]MBF0364614.1 C1 family peptidase [Oligoflexia bacterium]